MILYFAVLVELSLDKLTDGQTVPLHIVC